MSARRRIKRQQQKISRDKARRFWRGDRTIDPDPLVEEGHLVELTNTPPKTEDTP